MFSETNDSVLRGGKRDKYCKMNELRREYVTENMTFIWDLNNRITSYIQDYRL